MIAIAESEMNFGDFDETNIFHIEKSRIYKELGTGIKIVEFILKYKKDTIPWRRFSFTLRDPSCGGSCKQTSIQ